MKVSVIIAHDDRRGSKFLDDSIKLIKKDLLDYKIEGEIIVKSEGSKSYARNKAVEEAKGEVYVFLDDDVKVRSGFFNEILKPFSWPSVGVVGAVNVCFPSVSKSEEFSAKFFSSPFFFGKSVSRYTPRGAVRETDESEIIGCCFAVRSEAFKKGSGFPYDVIPCEENFLVCKIQSLGWKIVYTPYAIVYHYRPTFPVAYIKKLFDYGFGRGLMLRKNRKVGLKMFWRPSFDWFIFFSAFFIHYFSYGLGLCYGFLKNDVRSKQKT